MRILLAALSAFALSSTAIRGQNDEIVTYDIDFSPPVGPSTNWAPPGGTGGAYNQLDVFRLRVNGHEGGWVRPVMNFVPAPGSAGAFEASDWVEQGFVARYGGAQGNTPGLVMPLNPGYLPIEIEASSNDIFVPNAKGLQRWLTFMTTNGSSSLVLHGVKTWAQPLTTTNPTPGTISPTTRVWTSDAPLWEGPGTGVAERVHRELWRGILDGAGSTTTFNAYKALRWALIEHALYDPTVSLGDVQNFFESQTWVDVLNYGHLHLAIQLVAARAGSFIVDEFPTDTEVPDLSNYSPSPRMSLSESTQFVVKLQSELLGSLPDINGSLVVPGTWLNFNFATGRGQTLLSLETTAGNTVIVEAESNASLYRPAGYRVYIPSTTDSSSPIRIKTGNMTAFQWIGQVQVP